MFIQDNVKIWTHYKNTDLFLIRDNLMKDKHIQWKISLFQNNCTYEQITGNWHITTTWIVVLLLARTADVTCHHRWRCNRWNRQSHIHSKDDFFFFPDFNMLVKWAFNSLVVHLSRSPSNVAVHKNGFPYYSIIYPYVQSKPQM